MKRNVDLNEFFPPGSHEKPSCKDCKHCNCKKDVTDKEIIEKVSKEMIKVLENKI